MVDVQRGAPSPVARGRGRGRGSNRQGSEQRSEIENRGRGSYTWRERRAVEDASRQRDPQQQQQQQTQKTQVLVPPSSNQSKQHSNKAVEAEKVLVLDHEGYAQGGIPRLVSELEYKLSKGEIECMICYEGVGRKAPIWSCSSCYSIFHLTCTRKWARTPASLDRSVPQQQQQQQQEQKQKGNWRCPGCQAVQFSSAEQLHYVCFCGQQVEPQMDLYLTPHSCGGPCQKSLDRNRNECKHRCTLRCHPGPCPPCVALAAPETCGCGRKTVTRRCADKDGSSSISCRQICDKSLHCGRHRCNRLCHEGDCGSCDAVLPARCFCGRKQQTLACRLVPVTGALKNNNSKGVFSCEASCSKLLGCKNHTCPELCHPGLCGDCALLPSKVTSCACGKSSLEGLAATRKSCLDPIPTCDQTCDKLLSCGKHACSKSCHTGPCSKCEASAQQDCRCGSCSRSVPCSLAKQEAYVCDRKCGKKMSCGRHRCNAVCCDGKPDSHLCILECGKKLRCGQHRCEELCHAGHCPPCLQSSFSDLTCACGKSFVPPPVPCGTPRPRCDLPCSVAQLCGHQAAHSCHFGECPPCSLPVCKPCSGGHMLMKNVPCSKEISCSMACGKTRRCGRHACSRTCHSGPCDDDARSSCSSSAAAGTAAGGGGGAAAAAGSSLSCGQVCGAFRRNCPHTCLATCHPTTPCPDNRCEVMVEVMCGCRRLTAKVPCDVGGGSYRDPAMESRIVKALPAPFQPAEEGSERLPFSARKLSCDDECAKAAKLRSLAEALGIASAADAAAAASDSGGVPDAVQEMLRKDYRFVSDVEDRFKYLLTTAPRSSVRLHVFCALTKDRREAVQQLAQMWSLSVSSVGWEPKRSMLAFVNAKSRLPAVRMTRPTSEAPRFNPAIDMEPRLVVGLFELPREADVSRLVLRFGGECELVWMNDRNAVAIFSDAGRAATALRRIEHAREYRGASARIAQQQQQLGVAGNNSRIVQQQQQQQQLGISGNGSNRLKLRSSSSSSSSRDPEWVEDNWEDEIRKGAWFDPKAAGIRVNNPWDALSKDG